MTAVEERFEPAAAALAADPTEPGPFGAEEGLGLGRVVGVWGPSGAPGRTTVALHLAGELAELGVPTLLIDADAYGGAIAQQAGLVDEAPGLVAACRAANAGALDVPRLAGLCRELPGSGRSAPLRLLTGIVRANRWPELRPAALDVVLRQARQLAEVVLVDCGFNLENDEELSYDTVAPRRNGATLAVLDAADLVLAVGSADPLGLARLVRGLDDLRESFGTAGSGAEVRVVVNRLRRGGVPGSARREVAAALARHAGVVEPYFIPLDVAALDSASAAGTLLCEAAPSAPAREALTELARSLPVVPRATGAAASPTRRTRLRRRRRGAIG